MNAPAEQPAKTQVAVKPAEYNQLVAAARLRDIRLLKSEFSLDPEALQHQADWKMSSNCDIQNAHYDPESEVLIAWVLGEAICKKKNKRIITSRCRYLIVYDVAGKPEEQAVSAFAKRVARFAVYPYFRAHFAEVCSQAGVTLPPLPIIKETKLIPKVSSLDDKPKQIA